MKTRKQCRRISRMFTISPLYSHALVCVYAFSTLTPFFKFALKCNDSQKSVYTKLLHKTSQKLCEGYEVIFLQTNRKSMNAVARHKQFNKKKKKPVSNRYRIENFLAFSALSIEHGKINDYMLCIFTGRIEIDMIVAAGATQFIL